MDTSWGVLYQSLNTNKFTVKINHQGAPTPASTYADLRSCHSELGNPSNAVLWMPQVAPPSVVHAYETLVFIDFIAGLTFQAANTEVEKEVKGQGFVCVG